MRIPKRLKALLSNLRMRSCEHKQHTQQHNMTSNATGLGIVNLQCGNRADLRLLDVVEVDVMGGGVDTGEKEDGVGELAVHPQVLVEGKKAQLGADEAHDCATDGEKD